MRPYLKLGEPEHRPERMHLDDHEIVSIYGAEYRGIIQYYLLAGDVWRLEPAALGHVDLDKQDTGRQTLLDGDGDGPHVPDHRRHTVRTSTVLPGQRPKNRQEAAGRTVRGCIPLRRQKKAILIDRLAIPGATRRKGREPTGSGRAAVSSASKRPRCTCTTSALSPTSPNRDDHSQRGLAMAKRRRKTLVVCRPCHDIIHARPPTATPMEQITGEP